LKVSTSIKLKAAILMVVFAQNTIVAFACSLGVDMGYNSGHHEDSNTAEAVVHIHKDGKKHVHYEKKKHSHAESSHHGKTAHEPQKENDNGNCCSDDTVGFDRLDKSVPKQVTIIHPFFAATLFIVFYKIDLSPHFGIVKDIRQFARSYHPPIPDIRIAIQSFQI
jgi:hypothetical protein